jgi:KDO2-lipid IV(A) lauroyltransferase
MKKLKYFIEYLIIRSLFFYFKLFSIDKASDIGASIARAIGPKLPINKIAINNIKRAMKDKTDQEIKEIILLMWDNIGRVAAEFPHIFNLSDDEFNIRLKIEGRENIPDDNKGKIFFSGHLANWEMCPRFASSLGDKTALIYRKANNDLVDQIMTKERTKNNIEIIAKGINSAKDIIKILKNSGSITMLIDQKMNDGIAVPFFGIDAMTAPAIARLAKKYDAHIIPSQIIRLDKANFILKFYPIIPLVKTNNNEQDIYNIMYKINYMVESWIKEYPAQWFWLHNRWSKK